MPATTAQNLPAHTFGELLRHLRQRSRLTQDELGLVVGYSRAHIARLENSQRVPDPGAVKASFFEPLGLRADSPEAIQLVTLATAAHDIGSPHGDEPGPSAERQTPNNLPYPVTSFVGRTEALAELQRLLPTTRLLTLTGVGGTGKTRLALELAGRVLDDFPDGVWLVELAPVADPAQVPQIALTSIGILDTAGMTTTAALIDVLRNKRCLLILDNCEHVIDACAKLVDAVLHSCQNTAFLTTSRETLGIDGEQGWRVPSLSKPETDGDKSPEDLLQFEAIQLFVQRAKHVSTTFALTQDNSVAVRKICQRLDGIPLAIELAAARVKAMTPGEIAQRLSDRFRLLTGGSRTAMPRQQTLQAMIDWSYHLLTEPEQRLFCRLSVFSGGWSVTAAEAICSGEGVEKVDILNLLSRLVDKSLVLVDESGARTRYRFLETVRQFAEERLADSGNSSHLRDRHAAYFVAYGRQFSTEMVDPEQDSIAILTMAAAELNNVRRALDWSTENVQCDQVCNLIEHFAFLFVARSVREEPQPWAEAMLKQPEDRVNTQQRVRLILLLQPIYHHTDQMEKIAWAIEKLSMIGQTLNDPALILGFEADAMYDAIERKDKAVALRHFANWRMAATNDESISDHERAQMEHVVHAEIARLDRDFNALRREWQWIYEEAHMRAGKMQTSANARRFGYALIWNGELEAAREKLRESLVDNYALGDRHAVAACLNAFGALANAQSDPIRCATLLGASEAIVEAMHTRLMRWDRDYIASTLTELSSRLTAESRHVAWSAGRAMSLEQAMAYALEDAHGGGPAA